jgi:hypothetical protein
MSPKKYSMSLSLPSQMGAFPPQKYHQIFQKMTESFFRSSTERSPRE